MAVPTDREILEQAESNREPERPSAQQTTDFFAALGLLFAASAWSLTQMHALQESLASRKVLRTLKGAAAAMRRRTARMGRSNRK